MENDSPNRHDVSTQTSFLDINETTSRTVTTDEWDATSGDFRSFLQPQYRDVEVQTDISIAASIIYTSTSTSVLSPESTEGIETSEMELSPMASSAKEQKKSSDPTAEAKGGAKKAHFGYATSSDEEIARKQDAQQYRKSKFIVKARGASDDDFHMTESNLQAGHVFVYMVIPPDGGYGWFVMVLSFLCQVVVDGIIFGVGILLPHIAKDFGVSGSTVILLASTQVGCYFLFGTVSSTLLSKYGFRPVALMGSMLSIIVLSTATFSTHFVMMLVFFSVLGGPCLSMVWVSSQLVIGYYFDKYRPIANGISCSGAGVGIMIFSYMNNVLMPKLGWRNLMRLHVTLLVLVFFMGFCFKEVAPTRIGRVLDAPLEESEESDSWENYASVTRFSRFQRLSRFARFSLKIDDDEYSLQDDFENTLQEYTPPPPEPAAKNFFEKFCCACLVNWWKQPQEATPQGYVIKQDLMDRQDLFYDGTAALARPTIFEPRKTVAFGGGDMRVISLDDLEQMVDVRTLAQRLSSVSSDGGPLQDRRKTYHELKKEKKCPIFAYLRPENWLHPKIRVGISKLFKIQLLALIEFRILVLSAFLFPMGFNIPFVYSTGRVQIPQNYAKLISPSIGFSNFFFRIASGFIAYRFREYTCYICGGGMVFGGVAVFVSAFYGIDKVWFQFVYAICYGVAPAFFSTLRAIIYVQALGLDKLTNAFGLTALAMGMGVFIGTTAGGILNDLTGNYTAAFAFAGICIIASGALKLWLPFMSHREE